MHYGCGYPCRGDRWNPGSPTPAAEDKKPSAARPIRWRSSGSPSNHTDCKVIFKTILLDSQLMAGPTSYRRMPDWWKYLTRLFKNTSNQELLALFDWRILLPSLQLSPRFPQQEPAWSSVRSAVGDLRKCWAPRVAMGWTVLFPVNDVNEILYAIM